jgi:hypothetical protein
MEMVMKESDKITFMFPFIQNMTINKMPMINSDMVLSITGKVGREYIRTPI